MIDDTMPISKLVELERPFKALANRRRLAILRLLSNRREASVSAIASAIKLSLQATSKHLRILAAIGIIEREQRRRNQFYHLSPAHNAAVAFLMPHVLSIL